MPQNYFRVEGKVEIERERKQTVRFQARWRLGIVDERLGLDQSDQAWNGVHLGARVDLVAEENVVGCILVRDESRFGDVLCRHDYGVVLGPEPAAKDDLQLNIGCIERQSLREDELELLRDRSQ